MRSTYKKPEVVFYAAEELRKIEAKMSGGTGSEGSFYRYTQPPKPITIGYDNISIIIDKLEKLEDMYVEYNTEISDSPELPLNKIIIAKGVTNYLRHKVYGTILWAIMTLNPIDSDFVEYVETHNSSLEDFFDKYISNTKMLADSIGGSIDLSHLAATIEGYITINIGSGRWFGWAGDLVTVTKDVRNNIDSFNNYQEAADYYVGNANEGSFGYADLCSDADAIKIADMILNSSSSTHALSLALEEYYQSYASNRFYYYIYDLNCSLNLASIKYKIWLKIVETPVDMAWLLALGFSGDNQLFYTVALEACKNSFANYINKEITA